MSPHKYGEKLQLDAISSDKSMSPKGFDLSILGADTLALIERDMKAAADGQA